MEVTGPPRTIKRAKQLRREMSLPEVLLWRELRKRPSDLKFRRQHPAGQRSRWTAKHMPAGNDRYEMPNAMHGWP